MSRPLRIALPKGRMMDEALTLFARVGAAVEPEVLASRRLILPSADGRFEFLPVKSGDVPVYVESGVADAGVVLFAENWHPGVVGIVAGRVTRKYNRPCVVLGNEGDMAKGSGRSVDGINLVEVLGACAQHLTSWGGHPMAVGIALPKVHLESFRAGFAQAVRDQAGGDIAEARLDVAVWLTPEQITERLMDELEALRPFGQGNPEPVFGVRGVLLRSPGEIFKEQHIRFHFEDGRGRWMHGVAWKLAHRLPSLHTPLDLAVELEWN